MKKIFRYTFALISGAFMLTSCGISFNGSEGEIVHNLTKLPSPVIREVIDDYVYWDEVPNASSYVVKINGISENAGNSLKYSIGAILDSRIEYNVPTVAHITVLAKGNQILFGDSDPSAEYTYTYTKKEQGPVVGSKISAPKGVQYSKGIISWQGVENCIGYRVKIDEQVFTTIKTQFDVSPLFSETRWFSFSLQAVAEDGYEDSSWTLESNEQYVVGTSEGDGKKTYLQPPSNIYCLENIIHWNHSENAIGYEIKIDNAVYTTSSNYYDVSRLFTEETYFTYSLRSIASSVSNYYSSDWSLPTEGHFVPQEEQELEDFSEANERNVLGRNINVLNAKDLTSNALVSGAGSIFNEQELYKKKIGKDMIRLQEESAISSSSFDSFVEKQQLDVSARFSSGKGEITLPWRMDYNVSLSGGYEKVSKEQTSEFYYNLHHNETGKRIEIQNYRTDIDSFKDILSDQFKNAAKKVTNEVQAKQFINTWGTHVVMAAYYGAAFDAKYYKIEHKTEDSLGWYESAEVTLTEHLLFSSHQQSVAEKFSNTKEDTKESRIAQFTCTAFGGASSSFIIDDISQFSSKISEWKKTVNESNWVMMDVPDNSLYCIWDFLDDSFSEQKAILNSYLVQESKNVLDSIKNKMASIYDDDYVDGIEGDVITYQSSSKTMTIDLSGYQNIGNLAGFTFDEDCWAGGIFTIKEWIDFKEIQNVIIKARHGLKDKNGDKISSLIDGFSLRLSDYWNGKTLHLTLENLGIITPANKPFISTEANLDISIKGEATIVGNGASGKGLIQAPSITIHGESDTPLTLQGGSGSTSHSGDHAISTNDLYIDNTALTAVGGNGGVGKDGTSYSSTASGDSTSKPGGDGERGGDGGDAIHTQNFDFSATSLNLTGGNGGNGGLGGNAQGSNVSGHGHAGKGGNGGVGGNGGSALYTKTMQEGAATRKHTFTSGNGGNGGKGGVGGSEAGSTGVNRDDAGPGGNGGNGGDSSYAIYAESGLNLNKNITIHLGKPGDGGVGGKGGTSESYSADVSDPGNGGAGGNGGNSYILYGSNNPLNANITSVVAGAGGTGGSTGKDRNITPKYPATSGKGGNGGSIYSNGSLIAEGTEGTAGKKMTSASAVAGGAGGNGATWSGNI